MTSVHTILLIPKVFSIGVTSISILLASTALTVNLSKQAQGLLSTTALNRRHVQVTSLEHTCIKYKAVGNVSSASFIAASFSKQSQLTNIARLLCLGLGFKHL